MRKGIGVFFVIAGLLCLLGAAGLAVYNHFGEQKAEEETNIILEKVKAEIEMKEQEILEMDTSESIGILSIPVLELELPVLGDWSYEKLKTAPCHYYGSPYEENFVIMAHNYHSHFGRLSELMEKDLIIFTDMTGKVFCYEVVLLETLSKTATEEMLTSGFDLSLYTCTPSGSNRITVRCKTVEIGR